MPEGRNKPQIIVGQDAVVGPWVCARIGGTWINGRGTTIGLQRSGELVAGILYEDCNGVNVNMHVASDGSRRWMTRELLHFAFWYPFEQLGVKRVTGTVPASNDDARRLDEHLGFVLEARLEKAHPDGDLLIYRMFRHECKWLRSDRAHTQQVYLKAA